MFGSIVSCQDEIKNYPQDVTASDTNGEPLDSFQFYFPHQILVDTGEIVGGLDTFELKWYSTTLFAFDEPILFNYYQGHEIYRFLYLRSFHTPIVISLHRDDSEVWIVTKKLDRQPRFIDFYEVDTTSYDQLDTTQSSIAPLHKLVKADRTANISLNEKKVLSESEWTKFDSLLLACQYRTLAPSLNKMAIDGSEWIIEAHLRSGYYFVKRWSPEDKFADCGKYLIELSGLQEDVY